MTKVTNTFTSEDGRVSIEMFPYYTHRVSIADDKIRVAIPESAGWKGRELALFENFVTVISHTVGVCINAGDEETDLLTAWWEEYRTFADFRAMWEAWLDLPPSVGNGLFVDAFKATRRNPLPASEEFQPGSEKRETVDPDFKKNAPDT